MNKYHLWGILYVLFGVIFVMARLWKKEKFNNMVEACNRIAGEYTAIALPVAMTATVLMWPIPFFRYVKRRIKGEKNEFD